MNQINFSLYIVVYNFIIGVLLMLASEKIGVYAGAFTGAYKDKVSRLTHIAILAFGACVAVLMAVIFFAFHLFRLHE